MQPWHEGVTLEMAMDPDETIFYIPQFCNCCGRDLSQVLAELVECRQEISLPVIQSVYIGHQNFQKTCPCGYKVVSGFPVGINPGISYGRNVESLAASMNTRQFVPFYRLAEIFRHVFNTPIWRGSFVRIIIRFAEKSIPVYELIRKRAGTERLTVGMRPG